jgi:diguanylate cyclase (GGDEF)-like protein
MNNTVATSIINVMALIILSRMVFSNNILIRERKKPFIFGIVLTITVILAEVVTIVASDGSSAWRNLNLASNVLGFMLTPFIPAVLLAIFERKVFRERPYMLLPAIFNGIAAILSPMYGFLFYVDADNLYTRGSLFFLFVTIYLFYFLLLVVLSVRQGQSDYFASEWNFYYLTMFLVSGTFVQLVFPSVYTSWHTITLSLFLYYLFLSEYDGRFDALTGLYNRSAFENDIRRLRKSMKYSIIVMDLNDFKRINDTLGHEYGDAVLQKVAAIIRGSFDHDCTSYRIGGDEFYVLCRHSDWDKIDHQLKSMTDKLSVERKNNKNLPTVAYGRSTAQMDIRDIQVMLQEADAEMYIYKQQQKERDDTSLLLQDKKGRREHNIIGTITME